jgi:hypothetical protein
MNQAAPAPEAAKSGFRNFFTMWFGQVISLLGSGLTAFAVGVWVYQETGNVTLFTLIAVSAALPATLLSPVAGVLVDRFDRKWVLVISDTGAALSSLGLLALFSFDALQLWHIYVLVGINAVFNTLQFPAFSASITMLIPKQHFGRASGMMQFGFSGTQVLAPLLAGFLLVWVSIEGIIVIDLTTFAIAVVLLVLFVHIPRPESSPAEGRRPSFWRQVAFGWEYIHDRPGLLTLLSFFAAINFLVPVGMVLVTPMVLSFAGPDELGVVLSIGSAGMLTGSLVMTAWGGPRRRMAGILGAAPVVSLGLFVAGFRPSVPLIACGLFLLFFVIPVINGCSQAIWQSKVEPGVQGRVFAMRRMVAQISAPVGYLIAGPVAERVFVPLLRPDGALAAGLGSWMGTGEGRGIGLMFWAMGALFLLVVAAAAAYPRMRNLEDVVPDAVPETPPAAGEEAVAGDGMAEEAPAEG